MVTFCKRKNGIYTKLSELAILCGADVGFLIYSGSRNPYTFGSPSFDVVAQRFLHGNHHSAGVINDQGNLSSMIVDAHKKVKVDEFCKNLNNLMEIKRDAEEKKLKMSEAAHAPSLPVKSTDASWKIDPKDEEEEKQLLRMRSIMRNCVRLLKQETVEDVMRQPRRRFLHMADGRIEILN